MALWLVGHCLLSASTSVLPWPLLLGSQWLRTRRSLGIPRSSCPCFSGLKNLLGYWPLLFLLRDFTCPWACFFRLGDFLGPCIYLFRSHFSTECMGGCSVRGGACVGPLGGLFCVRGFFLAGVLPPSWPCAFLFLVPAPLVPVWCVGAGLSCI